MIFRKKTDIFQQAKLHILTGQKNIRQKISIGYIYLLNLIIVKKVSDSL
jgi:hypothetical protein